MVKQDVYFGIAAVVIILIGVALVPVNGTISTRLFGLGTVVGLLPSIIQGLRNRGD